MLIILLILAVALIVISTTKFKLHPFLALLFVALLFGLTAGVPLPKLIESINEGFGKTLGSIGLVIIIGVMIGAFLENTGGAVRLANGVLKLIGKKRVPEAMSLVGWLISIPVFGDSGFVILNSLNKALTKKAGLSLTVTTVCLATGLMATHTMVPPTPGPIATAAIIGADLGLVIAFGSVISLIALIPPIIFAKKYASKTWLDPAPDLGEGDFDKKLAVAPGFLHSIIPVLIPLLLIVLKSFNDLYSIIGEGGLKSGLDFVGTPIIALIIGLLIAFTLPKKLERDMLSTQGWVGKALLDSASIVMITGAGGVFGKVLQNAGLGDMIAPLLADYPMGIFLPFLISAALKTAQGSSTVAMITTASIITPLIPQLGLDTEVSKALAVLAIGAGSAVVSHVSDSFFWLVTQMTGMTISMGYRIHTVATGIVGVSCFILIYIAHMIWG
ncbi:GntP family permease [Arcticibacterium luteifluviistationis]|uniref:Gluconate transporter n=1 Tax=Arcticibacterium luteifluviistationis TaxID=1784714 RepID=A0A2Z4GAF1_9BACT|nr:GntP family permease [Arcticibacterium luteifluviistationis]AWV98239.1 gluconate transporter [Arcticibacterium luteifluviistationis]